MDDVSAPGPTPAPARTRVPLLVGIASLVLVADVLTKVLAVAELEGRAPVGSGAALIPRIYDKIWTGPPHKVDRVLSEGDVVSLDCGAIVDGWHGDSALTFVVGVNDDNPAGAARMAARHAGEDPHLDEAGLIAAAGGDAVRSLVLATEGSMWAGIRALAAGKRLNDVGSQVEAALRTGYAELADFEIVDGYTGHGVGRELHQEPTVYNEAVSERLPKVETGLVVAVEPMVRLGTYETHELDDGWTVKTDDGSLAAHFEHTVAVTERGLWVLTAHDGGRSALGDLYGGLDD